MALNFPTPGGPIGDGHRWTDPSNGITYVYEQSTNSWIATGLGGGSIESGPNPPGSGGGVDPEEGDLWFNSNNGITYIYYINPSETEGQWVDVRPSATGGGGGGAFVPLGAWTAIPDLT